MTLTTEQENWVAEAIGAARQIDDVVDIEARKAKLLKEARQRIESGVGTIHVGEDFEVETLSEFLKRRITMASIGEDPNEEFDTGHDSKNMTGMDGKDFALLMNAQSIIAVEAEKLRKARNEQTNKPLFTDKEISDAIWQPLMRRKLIPENAIPDRYSEVSRSFSGASGEYETRLASFTDSLKGNEGVLKGLGLGKDIVDMLSGVAGAVVMDLGAMGKIMDAYEANTILKGVQATLSASMTVSASIVKEGGINRNNCEAIGKDLVKSAQGLINASFSGGSWVEANLGKTIAYAVGAAASGPAIYAKIKKGEYGAILDDIGDLIQAGLTTLTYEIKSQDKTDTGPGGTGVMQWNDLGALINGAIKAFRPALMKLFEGGEAKPEELLKLLDTALKAGIDAGSTWTFDKEKSGLESKASDDDHVTKSVVNKDDNLREVAPDLEQAYGVVELEWQALRDAGPQAQGLTASEKLIKEVMANGPKALEKLKKDDPALKSLSKMAEIIDKQNKAIVEQALKTFDQEIQDSNNQFRDMLNRSESGDSEEDVEKIEQLIMEMKKDQMILDLSLQLVSLPAQAIAAFLPQLGMVAYGVELIKNIYKAQEHFRAFAEWQENVKDAKSAMSIQVEAMTNRMDWSKKKGTDEVLSALENAAKVVGGAISYAGPFAAAGHVVVATVAGVSALRTFITKYYREGQLKEAWKLYQSALANPDDRKEVRKAIRKNPTLSKYVIAWGAEVDGNPVAKSAMKNCGLTADVLSNKNTNVQKVVSFLETMYPDDPQLLEAVDRPEEWYPGKVEFTAASFASFVGAAENAVDPKLQKGQAAGLVKLFARFEMHKKAAAEAQKEWLARMVKAQADGATPKDKQEAAEAEEKLRPILEQALRCSRLLLGDLKTFKPVDAEAKAHKGFATYVRMLLPVARAYVVKYQRESEAVAELAEEEPA